MKDIPVPGAKDLSLLVVSCFRSNYVYNLLFYAYHFDELTWKNISFQNKVLFAFLFEPLKSNFYNLIQDTNGNILIMCILNNSFLLSWSLEAMFTLFTFEIFH